MPLPPSWYSTLLMVPYRSFLADCLVSETVPVHAVFPPSKTAFLILEAFTTTARSPVQSALSRDQEKRWLPVCPAAQVTVPLLALAAPPTFQSKLTGTLWALFRVAVASVLSVSCTVTTPLLTGALS